jgi:hypothetical protein
LAGYQNQYSDAQLSGLQGLNQTQAGLMQMLMQMYQPTTQGAYANPALAKAPAAPFPMTTPITSL